jgi:hypothetical protein
MKDGLYTFDELSQYMDKAKEPLNELVKASQEREKFWHCELIKSQSKIEEMQKALNWYADEENYDLEQEEYYIKITIDRGDRARQALKGANQ